MSNHLSKRGKFFSSLYKKEELPLFGKEGRGEIFGKICLLNYELIKLKIEDVTPNHPFKHPFKYLDPSILF